MPVDIKNWLEERMILRIAMVKSLSEKLFGLLWVYYR
jgi:hypothetical protein